MRVKVTDKYTGEIIAEIEADDRKKLREKIADAHASWQSLKSLSTLEKLEIIRNIGTRTHTLQPSSTTTCLN